MLIVLLLPNRLLEIACVAHGVRIRGNIAHLLLTEVSQDDITRLLFGCILACLRNGLS